MKKKLLLEAVSFQYEASQDMILKKIDLEIERGEWLSIIGPNGSGKSTLAKLMNGLLLPTEGSVSYGDLSVSEEKDLWELRRQVGMVFQNPEHQFVATRVRDDLAFGMENQGIEREEMLRRIERVSSLVGIDHLLEEEPHRLSGGQKQRVAIAGILAVEPEVVIFDEATSMLDPSGRKDVLATMEMLHERGMTIISVTHDMEEAILADRVLFMSNGQIQLEGTPGEVFANTDTLRAARLELPFSRRLELALKERGVELPPGMLKKKELIEALWTLKSKV